MDPTQRPPFFGGAGPPVSPQAYVPATYPSILTTPPAIEIIDPVVEFMKGNVHPPLLPLRVEDVPPSIEGLRQLASSSCWREAATLCEAFPVRMPNVLPHHRIQWRLAQAFAYAKMNMLNEAQDVIEKNVLRFTDGQNRYETYESYYPGKKGCMVPFALRFLYARLPLLKQDVQQIQVAQTRFYDLLEYCQQQRQGGRATNAPAINPGTNYGPLTFDEVLAPEPETSAAWKARQRRVKLELVYTHTQLQQHNCAIALLNDLLSEYTPEMRQSTPNAQIEYMELLQRLGSVHLEAGQLGPAEDAFSRVEAIDESILSPQEQEQLEIVLALNRGAMSMAQEMYARGYEEFESVLKKDPLNVDAANNQAICALYSCNLTEAIAILENLIRANPKKALTEPVVYNLCSLYDLQSEQSLQKKKVLQAVVHRYKGDFFPSKYLRLE